MTKGALHRVAGLLQLELGGQGICFYNVQPGFIGTERMAQDMGAFAFDVTGAAPPDVVGAVVAWVVSQPDAAEAHVAGVDGREIESQDVCRDLGLLPGWPA